MVLRFIWLYRGMEANVPEPRAHSAVGNKQGGRAVLSQMQHNAHHPTGRGGSARTVVAPSALGGGINKGETQSLSVQAARTTPPRRGGQTVPALTLLVKDKLGGNGLDIAYCETQKDREHAMVQRAPRAVDIAWLRLHQRRRVMARCAGGGAHDVRVREARSAITAPRPGGLPPGLPGRPHQTGPRRLLLPSSGSGHAPGGAYA